MARASANAPLRQPSPLSRATRNLRASLLLRPEATSLRHCRLARRTSRASRFAAAALALATAAAAEGAGPELDADLASGAADQAARRCAEDYGQRFEELQALSGIETRWVPREHMPEGHAEEVRTQTSWVPRDAPEASIGSGESAWLSVLFQQAREFVASCWASGGRFWEAEVKVGAYLRGLPEAVRQSLMDYAQPERHSIMAADLLRISLCAPKSCEAAAVSSTVLPRYLARAFAGFDVAEHGLVLPPPSSAHAGAQELSDWSELALDFAIIGVQMCGTSSLWQNLERHPEIGFTHGLEEDTDFFFTTTVQRRLLPLRQHVEAFNAGRWSPEQPRPAIVGLRHVVLLQFPLARYMLAQIPRLVAVVILCDPVGRAEKRFLNLCKDVGRPADCRREIVPFMSSPTYWRDKGRDRFWRLTRVADHLAEASRLFGRRLAVFHQDVLRHDPRAFYGAVATAVGATKPFDPRFEFGRYNAFQGHRSELCHNATLLEHLRNALLPEYEAQERHLRLSGESVPDVVLLRKTRCDYAADLRASGRCDQFTACK